MALGGTLVLRSLPSPDSSQKGLPYYTAPDGTRGWAPFAQYDESKDTLYYIADITKEYEFARNPQAFNDIDGHWAADSILFAAERGIFNGTGDGKFDPDISLTRAMFTAIIARLTGVELSNSTSAFTDVNSNAWYAQYIAWAVDAGIVNGVGDNKFEPERPITRAELATIIERFIKYMGFEIDSVRESLTSFEDAQDSWAKQSIEYLYSLGLLNGKSDTAFGADDYTTRAETSAVVERLILAVLKSEIARIPAAD